MLSDVSPWLVIMVLVFLGFILVVFNAKRDSALRAAAYTLVLSIIFIYVLTAHLVPEIRYKLPLPEYPQASADAHVTACCPLPRSSISITTLLSCRCCFARSCILRESSPGAEQPAPTVSFAAPVCANPSSRSVQEIPFTHPCRLHGGGAAKGHRVSLETRTWAILPLLHPFLPFFSRPSPSIFPSFVPCLVFSSPLARSAHAHTYAQAHARVLLA